MIFRTLFVALYITLSSFQAYAQSAGATIPSKVRQVVPYRTYGSYNFTVPPDVKVIYPYGCGAGGGGGGGDSIYNAGGGGGGSGKCMVSNCYALAVTPGETISISIGQGGQGGYINISGTAGNSAYITGAHSTDGTDSQFPELQAGKGGTYAYSNTGGTGGDGGGAANFGTGGYQGNNGSSGTPKSCIVPGGGGAGGGNSYTYAALSGGGSPAYEISSLGSSYLGGGGAGASSNLGYGATAVGNGVAGTGPTAGACGAGASGGGSNAVGGNGADACIFLEFESAYIVN